MTPRHDTRATARFACTGARRRGMPCGLLLGSALMLLSACTHNARYLDPDADLTNPMEAQTLLGSGYAGNDPGNRDLPSRDASLDTDWNTGWDTAGAPLSETGQPEYAASYDTTPQSALPPAPDPRYSAEQPIALSPVPLAAPVIALSDGRCQAREEIPAVYEQVMGEVQVIQAEIAPDGRVLSPPVYRKAPVPKLVRPRGEYTFDAVCGHQMTPDFISSLQRALAVRGYFAGNVTGEIDAPTSAAIRRFQADRGLDSAQLSLETARALGLITVDVSSQG